MKVLITGATGFFGRHLVRRLTSMGWDLYISNTKQGNLMDDKNLHIFNHLKFDYIFHLAAHTKAGDYCLYHKAEQFEINQKINTNILKYWNDFQPQAKMVAMGTSCSYSPDLEMVEENYLLGQPDLGLYTYAMTKRMLLVGLQSYAEQYGLKYLYFVPSTLFGPDFDLEDSHFIFDLIKKIYAGKYHNEKVTLWGDGYQKRELIYVDDAINIILNSLDFENKVLNLGSGKEYSIREYAQIICDFFGYESSKIDYDITKYVGVKSKKLNIDKLNLIYDNFTDFKVNLNKTVTYYKKMIDKE
jgi:GDP-L-fucose synthase